MSNEKTRTDLPTNFNELKKSVNRTANWRERFDAVEELGKYKSRETIELLKHSMTGDSVYKIQEAAYRQLKSIGEDVTMPERQIGEPVKGAKKIFIRVKKSLPKDHSYQEFKVKLKKMRIDVYDTYEGDKGTDFDQWLEETWSSLPAR
ncbi:HEAT repeat domain-containing protein [Bacillus sp. FJAT-45037]|uniref:HEAT repeat domain-containing protein n=1 Tax=Bacillus sp. FJAT-45037 TaxID=2011007 RepID=UPI000C244863|nr:HEAT repeat domain-containing protein [Bacillus sp. FJAT-45037]